jgi:polyisoprenoid-binding protein YceI
MSTQTSSRVALPTGTWNVDPAHSQVEFRVKHTGIATFKGRFAAFDGVIRTDDDSIASVEGSVDVTSIRTNDERLDGHLQSPDFFDAENHPKIQVKTTGPAEQTDRGLRLRADLTIRGITKPVDFDVQVEGHGVDPWGNERIALAAQAEIDRNEWNITWNTVLENGSKYLGERVTLVLDAEAIRQAA